MAAMRMRGIFPSTRCTFYVTVNMFCQPVFVGSLYCKASYMPR